MSGVRSWWWRYHFTRETDNWTILIIELYLTTPSSIVLSFSSVASNPSSSLNSHEKFSALGSLLILLLIHLILTTLITVQRFRYFSTSKLHSRLNQLCPNWNLLVVNLRESCSDSFISWSQTLSHSHQLISLWCHYPFQKVLPRPRPRLDVLMSRLGLASVSMLLPSFQALSLVFDARRSNRHFIPLWSPLPESL